MPTEEVPDGAERRLGGLCIVQPEASYSLAEQIRISHEMLRNDSSTATAGDRSMSRLRR